MPKVTTRRLAPGKYLVLIDKRATRWVIERGERPKMFRTQVWDVIDAEADARLFSTAAGLHGALAIIEAFVSFAEK